MLIVQGRAQHSIDSTGRHFKPAAHSIVAAKRDEVPQGKIKCGAVNQKTRP